MNRYCERNYTRKCSAEVFGWRCEWSSDSYYPGPETVKKLLAHGKFTGSVMKISFFWIIWNISQLQTKRLYQNNAVEVSVHKKSHIWRISKVWEEMSNNIVHNFFPAGSTNNLLANDNNYWSWVSSPVPSVSLKCELTVCRTVQKNLRPRD